MILIRFGVTNFMLALLMDFVCVDKQKGKIHLLFAKLYIFLEEESIAFVNVGAAHLGHSESSS